jgi:hypothetical protein
MHGGADRKDKTNIAGDRIKIHHNTFYSYLPIVIRGKPTEICEIHHNWFEKNSTPRQACIQKNVKGNLKIYRNQYGKEKKIK